MKKIYLFAALATMLAACSSNDLIETKNVSENTEDQAIQFGAYVNRGVTRAGWEGDLTTAKLQDDAQGFGVFGYYTNGELYNETAKPDFMYNQQVTYSGGQWAYAPLKYWPNEFGNNAASEEIDRLTFFAYAPYAAVTPSTGVVTDDATTGIVGMTRNTTSGNPLIKYYAELDPEKCVDLCWGVAKAAFESSVDGNANKVSINEPYIDVIKPKIGDKIDFDFKHALAQLNVQIDADVDVVSHASSTLDGMTRIFVRSVTFEGFTTKGALDLNSEWGETATTPNWYDISGNSKLSLDPITVFDGRRDSKEGVSTATAKNETPDDLNANIIQSGAYTTTADANGTYTSLVSTTPGVTNTAVNLFNSETLDAPVLVIPTAEAMKVTIVYDVETADASLSGYLSDGATRGTTIENAITQEIKLASGDDMELAAGKKYTVKLHLGMTSVKFEASVTDWTTGTSSNVDLPKNETQGSAWSTTTPAVSNVATTAGSYQYFIEGAPDGTINSYKSDANSIITSYTVARDGSRIRVDYTTAENTTVNNRAATIYVEVSGSATMQVNVSQKAAALGLGVSNVDKDANGVYNRASGYGFILSSTAVGFTDWSSATITVKDADGNTLEAGGGKDYVWNSSTKDLTILNRAKPASGSKKFTITVAAGNAAAETVTVQINVP